MSGAVWFRRPARHAWARPWLRRVRLCRVSRRRCAVAAARRARRAGSSWRARWTSASRAFLLTLITPGWGRPSTIPPRVHTISPASSRTWRLSRVWRDFRPAASATWFAVTRPVAERYGRSAARPRSTERTPWAARPSSSAQPERARASRIVGSGAEALRLTVTAPDASAGPRTRDRCAPGPERPGSRGARRGRRLPRVSRGHRAPGRPQMRPGRPRRRPDGAWSSRAGTTSTGRADPDTSPTSHAPAPAARSCEHTGARAGCLGHTQSKPAQPQRFVLCRRSATRHDRLSPGRGVDHLEPPSTGAQSKHVAASHDARLASMACRRQSRPARDT